MIAIELDHVSKSFKANRPSGLKDRLLGSKGHRHTSQRVEALSDVSFVIHEGESVALLGHNGAGKSTILKLLAGTLQPTFGTVTTRGRIAPLLELGAGFHPDLTGRENIFLNGAFLGLTRAEVRRSLDEIVEFSGLGDAINNPVRFYSSGMYARLGFSVAVHASPDIILIDEVLAVGDAEFQAKCLERMDEFKQQGRTMVLVTHSLPQATEFAQRAVVLIRGRVAFDGVSQEAGPAVLQC